MNAKNEEKAAAACKADMELAGYILFRRALADALENGLDDTRISEKTVPSKLVRPFPMKEPVSDLTFAYIARGVENYDAAKLLLDFNETVEARNRVLCDYQRFLQKPDVRKFSGNMDAAWGADYRRQVLPILEMMENGKRSPAGGDEADPATKATDGEYEDVLNLLYIANSRIWYSEDTTKYDANAVAGSEDTWRYFWGIAEKNGLLDECGEFLARSVLSEWRKREKGRNWYSDAETYANWDTEIVPLLEQCEYPMFPDYLRLLPQQLAGNAAYAEFRRREREVLDRIEPLYDL